jgi:hypothetical protein
MLALMKQVLGAASIETSVLDANKLSLGMIGYYVRRGGGITNLKLGVGFEVVRRGSALEGRKGDRPFG